MSLIDQINDKLEERFKKLDLISKEIRFSENILKKARMLIEVSHDDGTVLWFCPEINRLVLSMPEWESYKHFIECKSQERLKYHPMINELLKKLNEAL